MAREEPREDEHAEGDVTGFLVPGVFEEFGDGEDNVDDVHKAEDEVADAGLVVAVGKDEEEAGDDMMGEHLPVVFAAFFDVDDDDLLEPEGELDEVVVFEERGEEADGEVGPEVGEGEEVRGCDNDVLNELRSVTCSKRWGFRKFREPWSRAIPFP